MNSHRWTSRIGLPLLAKELLEQAARRRTYVLRTVYACLLFAAAFLLFNEVYRISRTSPLAVLGRGRPIFEAVMGLQFTGIYLFMPAISCGVFTQEKERNSLMLLFLTRLGPWTIVFEKLLSRVVPMLCFLLLSLPLMAFAYSLGGISVEYLWSGVLMLGATTFQVGSLAVCCSAWCRTTVGAFMSSYLIGILLLFGPGFFTRIVFQQISLGNLPVIREILNFGPYNSFEQVLFLLFAPDQFFDPALDFRKALVRSVPLVLSGGIGLALAHRYLVRRAFLAPRQLLLNLFQRLDRLFTRLNDNRITRGRILIRDKSSLPDADPVAWRETSKRSLGRARYLFRVFIAVQAPLAIVYILNITAHGAQVNIGTSAPLLFCLWVVAVLIVSVQAASLIAGERTRQTLDVLATTTLTGREILLQKYRSVQRVMAVLLVPFFSIFLFQTWWRGLFSYRHDGPLYLACSALSVAVYLPLVAWLSFLIGLIVRSQARAIIGSLGAIAAWCVLPFLLVVMPLSIVLPNVAMASSWRDAFLLVTLVSPATIVPLNEFGALRSRFDQGEWFSWMMIVMNFLWYGTMLTRIRRCCLSNADRFLGRVECE